MRIGPLCNTDIVQIDCSETQNNSTEAGVKVNIYNSLLKRDKNQVSYRIVETKPKRRTVIVSLSFVCTRLTIVSEGAEL